MTVDEATGRQIIDLLFAEHAARRTTLILAHRLSSVIDCDRILVLDGGKVAVEYGVYGVPETFFVDRAGTIRAKHVGAVTDEVIRGTLDRLL